MVKAAIIGATGYAGEELIKILLRHPEAEIASLCSTSENPQNISEIFPAFKNRIELVCKKPDVEEICKSADVVFLALPHKVSMEYVPAFLQGGKKVIDLSADYRLKDAAAFERWYDVKHKNPQFVQEAAYGLPEIYRARIKKSRLIANPGCYSTAAILGIAPAMKEKIAQDVIIDAKSAISGAGRRPVLYLHFCEVNESLKAYKVNEHQHMPEIEEVLTEIAGKKINIVFVPHLVPMNRGILATIYLRLEKRMSSRELLRLYGEFYKDEPFVRIHGEGLYPKIADVANTNFCDIGIKVVEEKNLAIAVVCIDNLLKGASGQAVQNMNIIFGFDERLGLV